jgi:hypothetical protein
MKSPEAPEKPKEQLLFCKELNLDSAASDSEKAQFFFVKGNVYLDLDKK